jgi:hypothetical protein
LFEKNNKMFGVLIGLVIGIERECFPGGDWRGEGGGPLIQCIESFTSFNY